MFDVLKFPFTPITCQKKITAIFFVAKCNQIRWICYHAREICYKIIYYTYNGRMREQLSSFVLNSIEYLCYLNEFRTNKSHLHRTNRTTNPNEAWIKHFIGDEWQFNTDFGPVYLRGAPFYYIFACYV